MADTFSVEFGGESFDTLGAPCAEAWADLAEVDEESVQAIAVARALALDVLTSDEDRARFKKLSRASRATVADYFGFVKRSTEAAAERPTSQPADSSDGLTGTEPKSAANSEDKDSLLSGRPDLQLAVMRSVGAA